MSTPVIKFCPGRVPAPILAQHPYAGPLDSVSITGEGFQRAVGRPWLGGVDAGTVTVEDFDTDLDLDALRLFALVIARWRCRGQCLLKIYRAVGVVGGCNLGITPMSCKLVHIVGSGNREVKVYRDSETSEFVARLFVDGKVQPEADYFAGFSRHDRDDVASAWADATSSPLTACSTPDPDLDRFLESFS